MSVVTATVEALVAEVKVLMVGSRQVTMSVAKQLDRMEFPWMDTPLEFEPMGRVRSGVKVTRSRRIAKPRTPKPNQYSGENSLIWFEEFETEPLFEFIGRRKSDGTLVLFVVSDYPRADAGDGEKAEMDLIRSWEDLPLIVLAGLR